MKHRKLIKAAILAATLSTPIASIAALPSFLGGKEMPSLAPMLEKVTPAVVNISVAGTKVERYQVPEFFRHFGVSPEAINEKPFKGMGSGVIINADEGYVITNHHVVDGASKIQVTLTDGRSFEATKIGSDAETDVAILQIESDDLTEIKLGNSDKLRVGDFSVAIGNPFGLGQTVTSGIIGALARSSLNIENYENFIQTDAAINSGNSGGALVNLNGELIGINTAIYGPNGGNVGIGFAIPINMANNVISQLIEHGEVSRGVLGIAGQDLNSDMAKSLELDVQQGGFVTQVFPDTAAEKAGIKAGDVITHVNDNKVTSFGQLRANVGTMGAGTSVELGILRDGEKQTIEVTLGSSDAQTISAKTIHKNLNGALFENSENFGGSVKVKELAENSPAARIGLEQNDLIIGVNRSKIKNIKQLKELLSNHNRSAALKIMREGASMYLFIN